MPGGMGEQSQRLRECGEDSRSREGIEKRPAPASDAEKGWTSTSDVQPLLLSVSAESRGVRYQLALRPVRNDCPPPLSRGADTCLALRPGRNDCPPPLSRGGGATVARYVSPQRRGLPRLCGEEGQNLWYSMIRERSIFLPVNRVIVWKGGAGAHY